MKRTILILSLLWAVTISTNAQSLIAHWSFDDGTGTTATDETGNGYDATLNGAVQWVDGILGGAIQLGSPDKYMQLPADAVFSRNNYTIATWIYLDELGIWPTLFLYDFGAEKYYEFCINTSDGDFINLLDEQFGGTWLNGSTPIETEKWYHVAVTVGDGTKTLYVNGVPDGTADVPYELDESHVADIKIGGMDGWSRAVQGKMDDYRFYDYALSAEEMTALFNERSVFLNTTSIGMGTIHVSQLAPVVIDTVQPIAPGKFEFIPGDIIQAEAVPEPGGTSEFIEWMGDVADSTGNPLVLTMDSSFSIIASFTKPDSENYYVSPSGSDFNDGSLEHPWKTISYAANQVYGGTVHIAAGIYEEAVTFKHSGTAENYITFMGEEGAIIDGSYGYTSFEGIVNIKDASYFILDGVKVRNVKAHGIKVMGNCKHVVIRNCITEHTQGCGILAQGSYGYPWDKKYYISDLIVEYNEVHWPQEGIWNDENIYHEDITFMQGVENFIIRYNYVNAYDSVRYSGGPIGIDVKDGVRYGVIHHNTTENIPSNGIYIDAWDTYAHHIDIYQNYVHNVTGQGIQIGAERGGPIDSVKVYNNIINKSGWVGISSGNYTGGDPPPLPQPKTHIDIFNNTIYQAGFRGWGTGIGTESSFKEGKIYNNIMFECPNNGLDVNKNDNNIITNNCMYKYPSEPDVGDYGDNPVRKNPQFIDPENGNFLLEGTSPCIDVGTADGAPDFDYDGTARPIGEGFEIGAYEVEKTNGISEMVLPDKSLKIFPNPMVDKTVIKYVVELPSNVRLTICDMQGKEVVKLVDKKHQAGEFSVAWNGNDIRLNKVESGMYMCKLQIGAKSTSAKILLMKGIN